MKFHVEVRFECEQYVYFGLWDLSGVHWHRANYCGPGEDNIETTLFLHTLTQCIPNYIKDNYVAPDIKIKTLQNIHPSL